MHYQIFHITFTFTLHNWV